MVNQVEGEARKAHRSHIFPSLRDLPRIVTVSFTVLDLPGYHNKETIYTYNHLPGGESTYLGGNKKSIFRPFPGSRKTHYLPPSPSIFLKLFHENGPEFKFAS